MNIKQTVLKHTVLLLCMLAALPAAAGIQFGDGDINKNNDVLFTVRHNIAGINSYRTLFKANIKNGTAEVRPEILTYYPEQMELLNGGKILQIRNRYGTVWYSTAEKKAVWNDCASVIPENSHRTAPVAASQDGKWICYIEKKNYATGALTLSTFSGEKSLVLDSNASFSYTKIPAKWQPNAQILLYEKNGAVYFCNPEAMLKGIEVSEEYRKIGPGTIDSVNWTGGKYLVYIDGDIVYRISSKELYTLGLYSGIIGKGTAIGRLPNHFNSGKDSFSVNKNLTAIVIIQGGKNFTLYRINGASCNYLDAVSTKSYTNNEGSLLDVRIVWPDALIANDFEQPGLPVPSIWMKTLPYNGKPAAAAVYRMNDKFSKILAIEDSGLPAFSPDKSRCAFFSGSTAYIYDTAEWKRIDEITGEKITSIIWVDSDTLYLGGEKTIRKWSIKEKSAKTIMLSQAVNAWWNDTGNITADTGNGKSYIYNPQSGTWSENGLSAEHKNVMRNENYRVFCGETPNSRYENALYVRSLKGKPVTKPLLAETIRKTEPPKTAALIFDAYDNADGLAKILYELNQYNIKGTFFLNGEFIRRYPNETKLISISGNECASLFFSTAKLVSKDFIMDEDFIRRGLARNEDEFFAVTGKELSLLWHAPYYFKSERLVTAGKDAGYSYVDASKHSYDTVTLEDAVSSLSNYYTPAELINIYMSSLIKNKGGIIPVTVGIAGGSRKSYVYDSLDLLISAILDEGFQIVPVRMLIQ